MALFERSLDVTRLPRDTAKYIFEVKTKRIGYQPAFILAVSELLVRSVDITAPKFIDTDKHHLFSDFKLELRCAIDQLNEVVYMDTERVLHCAMRILEFRIDNMLGLGGSCFTVHNYIGPDYAAFVPVGAVPVSEQVAEYNRHYMALSDIFATVR